MSVSFVPWALAAATAAWFGWMAGRNGRNWALWALGGGLFALVASTIIFGLGHASATPFSDQERTKLHYEWTVLSIVVIAVVGWLFTTPFHRHLLRWRKPKA
jgi:hypothetical protein